LEKTINSDPVPKAAKKEAGKALTALRVSDMMEIVRHGNAKFINSRKINIHTTPREEVRSLASDIRTLRKH